MTPGIHEYEYSRLPVLMNMNNVFKYKCVSNLQVKPGYTRKSPGIPEKYPSARPHAANAYSQGHCANCGAHRLLKYAHRTMCARYKCQNAKGSIGARHGLQAAVRTTRSCQHSATRSRRCSACACATPIN